MSKYTTVKVGITEGLEEWVTCQDCKASTSHKVHSLLHVRDTSPDGDMHLRSEFMIVQCQGCRAVSVVHDQRFSEDLEFNPDTGDVEEALNRKVYPPRLLGRRFLDQAHHLPHGVYTVYEEAHAALCNDMRVLAGIGIRAILEAVCLDRAVAGRNLLVKVDALATAGLVTADGAKILHAVRYLGNTAAHEIHAHSVKELGAAFAVIESLLHNVYVVPSLALALPKKATGGGAPVKPMQKPIALPPPPPVPTPTATRAVTPKAPVRTAARKNKR